MNHKTNQPEDLIQINESVFQHNGAAFILTDDTCAFLLQKAQEASNLRARICLHESASADVQEMIIGMCKKTQLPIHKHETKRESLTVLKGECQINLLNADNTLLQSSKLKLGQMISIPAGIYHELIIKTATLILHEVAQGPFSTESTIELKNNKS